MKFRTVVRDCLYLNWALPLEVLPELPRPLRYELHDGQGERYAFASAVLFRQQGLRLASLPLLRLSHPQMNLRFYVLDGDGVPSVFFLGMLAPAWVVPGGWLARQPVAAARFHYPRPSSEATEGLWRWSVRRRQAFEVTARPGSPAVGEGPRFASWETTVRYFHCRARGYSRRRDGLHRVEAQHPRLPVWPLAAEIQEDGLLSRFLPLEGWPRLHSAFLCPEIPFVFELGSAPEEVTALRRAPVAADPAMLTAAPRRPPRRAAA